MKLENKNLISLHKARQLTNNIPAMHDKNPLKYSFNNPVFSPKNDISFTGYDFARTFDKATRKITYSNMGEISSKIDKVLGNNYFTNALNKAGLSINPDKTLQIQDTTMLKDLGRTLKYPFVGLPLDLANWVAGGMKKVSFLSNLGNKIQSSSIIQKRAHVKDVERNFEIVNDILNNFANSQILGKKTASNIEFDSEKCLEKFKESAAGKLVNTAKNYSSRDERTLNRMATSTVSAIYGAWDFHNISMLQKDDKNKAKKAGKGRFKQEMFRMLFNAGTTFLTLGAFDKYIKHSMPLSILAIGASAFLAEVVSRLMSKTPIGRLTPKEAEQIALKQHPELAETLKLSNNNEQTKKDTNVSFKQKLEDMNKIFVQFQSHDGRFPAMKALDNDYANAKQNQKKKFTPKKAIIGAVLVASAGYIISSILKGKYKYKNELRAFYNSNREKIDQHIQNPEIALDSELMEEFNKISKEFNDKTKKFSIFKKVKKLITTKKTNIDLNDLNNKVERLKQTSEGSEIKEVLEKYFPNGEVNRANNILEAREDIPLLKGLYEGFAKLLNTVYIILSSPASLTEMLLDKTLYKKSFEAAEIIKKRGVKTDFSDEIAKLHSILKKQKVYKPTGLSKVISDVSEKLGFNKIDENKAYEDAANEIVKNARNFKEGPATGDLANFSRTLVTAISTFFFVNDYTNKVLIESAGKDVQKAKEERNQRLAHKASNFVFNGTLMNLFNSVFVKVLNRSLFGATLVATATETTNEFLVRKSICQPILPRNSKQEIIDFENKQMARKGLLGAWSRLYRKLTGKKSLTQKTQSK